MDHLGLVVGTHDPVVGTQVEVIWMSDLLAVSDLNLGGFDPLCDLHFKVKVVVDGVVVKLLLLDFLFLVT